MLPASKFSSKKISLDIVLTAFNSSSRWTHGKKLLSIDLNLRHEFPFVFLIGEISKPIIGADFFKKIKTKQFVHPLTKMAMNAICAICKISLPKLFFLVGNEYIELLKKYSRLIEKPDYATRTMKQFTH